MTAGEMLMMASLRDPYAAAAAGVGMLAASQLAQLNQLMMQQQQQQQHAQQLQMRQSPHSPSQAASSMQMGGPPLGTPLGMGSPPECQSPPISRTYTYKKVSTHCRGRARASGRLFGEPPGTPAPRVRGPRRRQPVAAQQQACLLSPRSVRSSRQSAIYPR